MTSTAACSTSSRPASSRCCGRPRGIDIQVRQQPLSNCWCRSIRRRRCGSARRLSRSTALGAAGISVYVNKHPCTARASRCAAAEACRCGAPARSGRLATITWPDGTIAKVFNAGGLGSGVLDVSVALAAGPVWPRHRAARRRRRACRQGVRRSPSGHPYPASVIAGDSRHDLQVRYDSSATDGGSRSASRCSATPAARAPAPTRSVGSRRLRDGRVAVAGQTGRRQKACRAAGVSTGAKLLDACDLDVAATGDKVFAAGDANLQRAVANAPGWSKLSPAARSRHRHWSRRRSARPAATCWRRTTRTTGHRGCSVASFPEVPGAPSKIAHTTPISGWSDLSSPLLVPTATGAAQLLISGTHGSIVADSLNGLDTLQVQPNGSFAAPVAIAPDGARAGRRIRDRARYSPATTRLLIWSTDLFLGVLNNTAYPPVAHKASSTPAGRCWRGPRTRALAYDTSGRLWLVWYALGARQRNPRRPVHRAAQSGDRRDRGGRRPATGPGQLQRAECRADADTRVQLDLPHHLRAQRLEDRARVLVARPGHAGDGLPGRRARLHRA